MLHGLRRPDVSPFINLLAVTDLEDQHHGYLVLDVVNDSIVANANPVCAGVGEFLYSHRARVAPECVDFLEDLAPDYRVQLTNLTLGGGRNLDAVGQAVASLTQFGAQFGKGFGALPGGLSA